MHHAIAATASVYINKHADRADLGEAPPAAGLGDPEAPQVHAVFVSPASAIAIRILQKPPRRNEAAH